MKARHLTHLFLTMVFAAGTFLVCGAGALRAQAPVPAVDPATHAAHLAAQAQRTPATPVATDVAKSNQALAEQLAQLQAKVTQLESVIARRMPPMAGPPAGTGTPGMGGAAASVPQAMSMGMGKVSPTGGMAPMGGTAAPAPAMAGMSGAGPPAGAGPGMMGMMGMMDKMMGMMDKMMSMGGDPPMPSGGAGMGMDMMKMGGMGGGGAMPATAPAAPMAMGGGMMGMMGMGSMPMGGAGSPATMNMASALPGFPGASHIYHIGATGFFLDHPGHITLTVEQQAALSQKREQALLQQAEFQRKIGTGEQELWILTAADQPDAAAIERKVQEVAKLQGDQRLAFIRSAGEAATVLTDEQRKQLTGLLAPASAPAVAPPAAMPAGGAMKDM